MVPRMVQDDDLSWVQLARSENVGPVTFQKLLGLYGTARKALDHVGDMAKQGGAKRPLKIADRIQVEKELTRGKELGAVLLKWAGEGYPALLSQTEGAPPLLWALGNKVSLSKSCCAIVGSRNASAAGLRMASGIAQRLSKAGYVTVSGLARGIDTVVHQNSLETGTIAVLAGGLDQIYPPENFDLYNKIASGGGILLSEMPFGTEPQARLFPRRNRIISGLARGTVVVEATLKSGSLVTARFALEQNRELFAVPGSPLDPRCEGTNNLIKQGAILVQTSQDVVDGLETFNHCLKEYDMQQSDDFHAPLKEDQPLVSSSDLTEKNRLRFRMLLSPTPVEMDHLIHLSELPPAVVLTFLLELELAGGLKRHGGGKVSFYEGASHSEDLF